MSKKHQTWSDLGLFAANGLGTLTDKTPYEILNEVPSDGTLRKYEVAQTYLLTAILNELIAARKAQSGMAKAIAREIVREATKEEKALCKERKKAADAEAIAKASSPPVIYQVSNRALERLFNLGRVFKKY